MQFIQDWHWHNLPPNLLDGVVLVSCLLCLIVFSLLVERSSQHDARYYRQISLRRWLWAIYLAIAFLYLAAVL